MTRTKPRQPYEPPRVRKISLVPDELAVTGCKQTGPNPTLCKRGAIFVAKTHGS